MNKSSGIILLNKPEDLSSNTASNLVKKIFSAKKAGHTGTLDPFAQGLLPVCINRGTRLVRYLMEKDKEYIGTIKLGIQTDTLDKTGEITGKAEVPKINSFDIENAMAKFRGKIKQIPPAFSALKHKGIPLYKYARKGEMIEKEAREINIFELETLFFENDILKIRVKCSKGTYIRTLASDLAKELGTLGHLTDLERTKNGYFDLSNSFTLEELRQKKSENDLESCMISLEKATDFIHTIKIDKTIEEAVINGKKILPKDLFINFSIEENIPFRLINQENQLKALIRRVNNCDYLKYDAVFN
ncbi:MAG: tRNA pseudouridine(55) synthase TruB [Desulforegulaceae bacterium]|nr:tRNA pseudouridine(55) synthase TruB [Desulforegulaceae bacterium]